MSCDRRATSARSTWVDGSPNRCWTIRTKTRSARRSSPTRCRWRRCCCSSGSAHSSARSSCCARFSASTSPRSPSTVGRSKTHVDSSPYGLAATWKLVSPVRRRPQGARRAGDTILRRAQRRRRRGVRNCSRPTSTWWRQRRQGSAVEAGHLRRREGDSSAHRTFRRSTRSADWWSRTKSTASRARSSTTGRQGVTTWTLDVLDGHIQAIRAVLNPDKLGHVGPVADAWAVLREVNEARRAMD